MFVGWGLMNDLGKEEMEKLKFDVEIGNIFIKRFREYFKFRIKRNENRN